MNPHAILERLERAANRSEAVTLDRDEVRALLDLIRQLSEPAFDSMDFL